MARVLFVWTMRLLVAAFAAWTSSLSPSQECHIPLWMWAIAYIWWYFF